MPAFGKAKSHNWVEADNAFGDFDAIKVDSNVPNKRKRNNNNVTKAVATKRRSTSVSRQSSTSDKAVVEFTQDNQGLWIDRHVPQRVSDLAVNSKKVEEVRQWLQDHQGKRGLLVLTGPAGCGKTACLTALCKELGLHIEEWINPVEQVDFGERPDEKWIPGDSIQYQGKNGQFKEWLRGAKYSNLSNASGFNRAKLILLEDLPGLAHMKGEEFLDILAGVSTVPVVLIISDGENGKKSKGALLPQDWLMRVGAKTIAFNPVTSINMVKLLTRIALEESEKGGRKFRVPEKAALENLAESVGGDLRGAVNALQFSCLNEVTDLREAFHSVNAVASSKAKKKAGGQEGKGGKGSSLSKIGGRDQRLQLFHALGKVLYSKRGDVEESWKLPQLLKKHARNQLQACPEEVVELSGMTSDSFCCFLHHNVPPFYTDIHEFSRLADAFSEADLMLREWGTTGKMSVSEYGGSVAARAVMFHNTKPAQVLGPRKFSAPEFFPANRTSRLRHAALTASFPSAPLRELVTSTAPLLARLAPAMGPAKIAAIRDVASFPLRSYYASRQTAQIGPGDVFQEEEGEEDELLVKAETPEMDIIETATENKEENDDEMVIEEFEDYSFLEEDFGDF